jgi:hypothetical protein
MTPHPTEPEARLDKAALAWEAALPLAAGTPVPVKKKRTSPGTPGEQAHHPPQRIRPQIALGVPLDVRSVRTLLLLALLLAVCAAAAAQPAGGRKSTAFLQRDILLSLLIT